MANIRLGTTTNLPTDGHYDILMVEFPSGFPEGKVKFGIDDNPKKITGVQFVAQTYLKILFTSEGSNVLYPGQGTNFQALTINSNIQSNDTLFQAELVAELKKAETQVKNILNNGGKDLASQLDNISILGIDVGQESIIMYLKLLTLAGETAQVAVPFPQLDMVLSN